MGTITIPNLSENWLELGQITAKNLLRPSEDVVIDGHYQEYALITQDLFLFTGLLRMKVDLSQEHEGKELWEALEEAEEV